MPNSLGSYPLTAAIVNKDGTMTPDFEKVFRAIYTNTQGAVKPVGVFAAQDDSVTLPANTLRDGSNIDIIAEYGGVAGAGTVIVSLGGIQLAAVGFAAINGKVLVRLSVNVVSGANASWCVYSSTDNAGVSTMGVESFTMPDMTEAIDITVTHGASSNFLAVKTYT